MTTLAPEFAEDRESSSILSMADSGGHEGATRWAPGVASKCRNGPCDARSGSVRRYTCLDVVRATPRIAAVNRPRASPSSAARVAFALHPTRARKASPSGGDIHCGSATHRLTTHMNRKGVDVQRLSLTVTPCYQWFALIIERVLVSSAAEVARREPDQPIETDAMAGSRRKASGEVVSRSPVRNPSRFPGCR